MEGTVEFFGSFFANPTLIGIGLAIAFGAVWLAAYWPPLFRVYWLWAVLALSAFLTLLDSILGTTTPITFLLSTFS